MYVCASTAFKSFGASFSPRPLTSPREPGSDVNSTVCCPNSAYCVVNETTFETQCCDLGSSCGLTCPQDSYYSLLTSTITDAAASTVTTETAAACVGRRCTSTWYVCPRSVGGGCCPFGSDCISGGSCLFSETAPTMAVCTSGLFSCGQSTQESRCCPSGAVCTSASPSGYYCASSATAPSALPTTVSVIMLPTATAAEASSGSDDVALKVGLGVGIPVGVIGIAVLVFAWRIRRARKQRAVSPETHHKADYEKPELAAVPVVVPAELDTGTPELPAQILEAELSEEGIMAELPGEATSQMSAHEPKSLQEHLSETTTANRPSRVTPAGNTQYSPLLPLSQDPGP